MVKNPQPNLPLFYKSLVPLNSGDHGNWRARAVDKASWVANQHLIPITVEEFPMTHRHYPIVFASGDNSFPMALLGMNEGVNLFFDAEGAAVSDAYIPAYVRRYPFILARLTPDAADMTLCFDPSNDLIGEFEEGTPLFSGDQPTEYTRNVLEFCQRFEEAGARTRAFVETLKSADVLVDGEIAIQQSDNADQPYVYRGFKMVSREKLNELDAKKLKEWHDAGILPHVYAHLMSLELMRELVAKQVAAGRQPATTPGPSS